MKIDFTGRTALVTGATRGIGAAIAAHLKEAGADLILTGTNKDQVAKLNEDLKQQGVTNIRYVCADFLDEESTDNFLSMLSMEDKIDVCINNAGINRLNPIDKVTIDDFDATTRVNYRAPYLISQTVSKIMRKNNYGRIVNIASIWSVVTKAGRSSYAASKTGLLSA